jgi:exopolysaccharide production protein ExoY
MTPAVEHIVSLKKVEREHSLRWIYCVEPLIAAVLLVLTVPLLISLAAIITVLARRTPLVRHLRVGWRGSALPMYKLRTMWEQNQEWGPVLAIEDVSNTVPLLKNADDDRVTSRFAAWCRRFSLDELPQVYHIVRREMSFVGPRPITRQELDEHYGSVTEKVLSLRPGLTGLWQVMGRSRLSYAKRKRLDLWLVRYASPGLYFRILYRSIPSVLHGHDAY